MNISTEAIYENGVLRPVAPLALPEHARVRVAVEPIDVGVANVHDTDDDRAQWLALSERQLMKVWDNSADDVFNDLLSP